MNTQDPDDFDFDGPDKDDWNPEPSVAELIEALAKMPPLDYDKVRVAFAKEHRIRTATLDAGVNKLRQKPGGGDEDRPEYFKEVDPWDEPINGSKLPDTVQ